MLVPLADHEALSSPVKLSPMFSSAKPVTVPLVAANAVMVTFGSSAMTMHMQSTSERNRFHVFSFPYFLLSLMISGVYFYVNAESRRKCDGCPDMRKVE